MTALEQAAAVLPEELRRALLAVTEDAEELHLRAGRPFTWVGRSGREQPVLQNRHPLVLTQEHLRRTVEIATAASYHASREKLAQGFLPLRGGHRLGLVGTAELREGKIHSFRSVSSLCIRVAHAVRQIGGGVAEELFRTGEPPSVLLLGPPGSGKTTLLRELLRLASDRYGIRVGLADERSEVAGLWEGVPQFSVGQYTDVLDGCPKGEGLLLLLRGMSPRLLAADEVTAREDIAALSYAANCGVPVMATAHARSAEELRRRPLYRAVLEEKIFSRAVLIRRTEEGRRYLLKELEGC